MIFGALSLHPKIPFPTAGLWLSAKLDRTAPAIPTFGPP